MTQNAPEAVDLPVRSSTITALVGLDALTVHIAGELDITSNTEATVAFADNAGLRVVVDMTDLDFIDCGGHCAIAAARRNTGKHGNVFTIEHAPGEPARLLGLRRGGALSDDVERW